MSSLLSSRRDFLRLTTAGALGGCLSQSLPQLAAAAQGTLGWDPKLRFRRLGAELVVQPVFMFRLPTPRAQASWKSWGGIQTASAVVEEIARIEKELRDLAKSADFKVRFRPVIKVDSLESAQSISNLDHHVTLVYACTGSSRWLQACLSARPDNVIFVRHRSGPVYYYYESLSTRFLSTDRDGDQDDSHAAHVDDVVVDDQAELRGKLKALFALRNLRNTRIVALGGPWGKYSPDAPEIARKRYGIDIIDVGYDVFEPRLRRMRADQRLTAQAEQAVSRFLAMPGTKLQTERQFLVNAFLLYRIFKDLMEEHDAPAFTIKSCMGTIIPMSETTACLSLGLLNDEGWMAFCESDFVIIPAGILLRYASSKPVFLHNSTFPHKRTVTCAHCASPRRFNADRYEPMQVMTHYESEYGAAPKVEIPVGQEVCFVDPQYSTTRWLGFKGRVKANPFYDVCRSQQDVEILGDWRQLIDEVRDSHWAMVYGDALPEMGHAARKLGINWTNLSEV